MVGLHDVTVQFNFNLRYIVHMRANCHINSILKEFRKLMDLPRATGENNCVIKNSSELNMFFTFLA